MTIESLKQEAFTTANGLVESFPDDAESFAVLGQLQFRLGNSAEAVNAWENCLERDPGHADACFGIAGAAMRKGEFEKAVTLVRQALEHDPAWSQGNILLARALMDLGRMTEAASVLEQNIKTSPDSVETRFLLGRAYLQLKQYEKAQGNFEAVIARDPATPYPYYGLARIYAHLGQKEKARQYSEQFRRLKAADDSRSVEALRQRELDLDFVRQTAAWTHVCAGQVHHTRGDPAKRAEHWRRAIQLDPICREALLSVCREAGLDPAQLLAGQGNPGDQNGR